MSKGLVGAAREVNGEKERKPRQAEQLLWLAVLLRALNDLTIEPIGMKFCQTKIGEQQLIAATKNWIFDEGETKEFSCRWACESAGISYKRFLKIAKEKIHETAQGRNDRRVGDSSDFRERDFHQGEDSQERQDFNPNGSGN